MIKINMKKAVEIHKERIRQARDPLLKSLDVEYIRALEAGDQDKISEIAKKKQELRDATKHPSIAKAKTPEELKAVIPPALKGQ